MADDAAGDDVHDAGQAAAATGPWRWRWRWRWRPRRPRRLAAAAVLLVIVGVEVRSQVVQRHASDSRQLAAADRRTATANHEATIAIETELAHLRRDDSSLAAELAAARARLVELDAAVSVARDQEQALAAELETVRGELDRAGLALLAGDATIGDLRTCIEATQQAVNLASVGQVHAAHGVLASARSVCDQAAGTGG